MFDQLFDQAQIIPQTSKSLVSSDLTFSDKFLCNTFVLVQEESPKTLKIPVEKSDTNFCEDLFDEISNKK